MVPMRVGAPDGGHAGGVDGMMNEVRGELFLRRLPPEIRDGLRPDQKAAIRAAAGRTESESHRIDIRFTLPTPWGPYYVALFAGPERRSAACRQRDRERRPLIVAGAALSRRAWTAFLCLLLLAGLLVYGAVVEF